jgi:CRP/FNR family transcriptional regulator
MSAKHRAERAAPLQQAQRRPGSLGEAPCAACPVRGLTICNALEEIELDRLSAIATHKRYSAKEMIFHAGDPAEYLCNVISGAVKLCKLLPDGRQQVTGFLFAGDFVGIALNDQHAYSAEAIEDIELCRFPRQQLERLLGDMPHLERRLLGAAANELIAAQDQMLLLGRKTAQERVATFLLSLSRRAAARGDEPDPVRLPMSRADIADYLGLTTETVSRTISGLKRQGTIRLDGSDRVHLADLARLEDLAEGGGAA